MRCNRQQEVYVNPVGHMQTSAAPPPHHDNDEISAFRVAHRLAPFALGRHPPFRCDARVGASVLLIERSWVSAWSSTG